MLVSLIIPVYNVEKYLGKCLSSCMSQDLSDEDYEIIIVNDGSTDNSLHIAEYFSSTCNNIRIITQNNKGLSEARNTGLHAALGKYVWFIDSDDWISDNCLKTIVKEMEDGNLDVLHIGSIVVYDDEHKNVKRIPHFSCSSGIEVIGRLQVWHQAQLTVFNRFFLIDKALLFYPNIYHEDMEFIPRAYYFAKRCCSLSMICYHYYQRPVGAITSEYKPKNISDALFVINRLTDFGRENIRKHNDLKLWNNVISVNINNVFRMASKLSPKYSETIEDLMQVRYFYHSMIMSKKMKYILSGLIMFINPKIYFKLINYK